MRLSLHVEEWAVKSPFRIAGHSWDKFEVVVVELMKDGHRGWGEGFPIPYLGESIGSLCEQIEAVACETECGLDRRSLLESMPAGSARNAIDCALWDLETKLSGRTIWKLSGIEPKPITTVFTIGIEDTPEEMAARARQASAHRFLKIKVDADRPVERVEAIRASRPDATLMVDANQAWSFQQLKDVTPRLAELGVTVIEQPLPKGGDEVLDAYTSSIPLCADESFQGRGDLAVLSQRYQIVNIKLDKAGGLTEALVMADAARSRGLKLWVGNMGGTSLAMAPAFVLAQRCDYTELDGFLLLKYDRFHCMSCENGEIEIPDCRLWG